MTNPPPDGSRDRRIEDPSNLYIIHPLARRLLRPAIRIGISANLVSILGLALGLGAALCYANWQHVTTTLLGFILSIGWLVADGLDGMVARATDTSSAIGRTLDGLCDHGVFVAIYVAIALSVGTAGGWALAIGAGACHAVQSNLYEGERARFHRRARAIAAPVARAPSRNPLVRLYDGVADSMDRATRPFDRRLALANEPRALANDYVRLAIEPMRLMTLQTANVRVAAIFIACLLGDPRLFWWFEIGPLSLLALIAILLHRRVERSFMRQPAMTRQAHSIFTQGNTAADD